ncbi:tRNA pseudouridine synthase A [Desulfocucumis palustris]|uniref:tRNA pseudouridine synthase A n=1 Tax=Desulfocucumis palustris TaxID=1898651 RepID=A0A2L2X7H9_9FIRM|nr:tRNA pseudouridine(38-40) synthase TruA [Desulfocucumis palustris]GBF31922.1 tRNA pseudouridine synthase A [Desulfocucumis palustris]
MRNIKLTVAYDGTRYHGFQEQRGTGLPTIQEELEKALQLLSGQVIRLIGAGRTDSGVHARGQVVNFDAGDWRIPTDRIPLAMNSRLPVDIAVLSARDVPEDFHARFSAVAKTYIYSIYNSRVPDPLLRRFTYFVPRMLDHGAMDGAGAMLVGRHDFSAFKAEGTPVKSTVRTIYGLNVGRHGNIIKITVRGDGFLYNMVRIIAGTLLEVGLGKQSPEYLLAVLKSKRRELAGATVPPQGLCLLEVEY